DRGGVRSRSLGSDRPRSALAGPAAPAAGPRRGAPLRAGVPPAAPRRALVRNDLRHAPGRRPRAAARDPPPLRLARALARRVAGGARRGSRPTGCDRAEDLRAAAQGRPRVAPQSRRARTAVPYAQISVQLPPISDVSKRMATIASAPFADASSTIRSITCWRLSTSAFVIPFSSPPRIDLKPAPSWDPMLRDRTVRPKTSPSVSVTSYPG